MHTHDTSESPPEFSVVGLDLHDRDGEPRIRDLDLAERLGFAKPAKIRELISRNLPELGTYAEVSAIVTETSEKGGRPGREYWLAEGQALVICALSRTPFAAAVRKLVIDVFMAWRLERLKTVHVAEHCRRPPRRAAAAPRREVDLKTALARHAAASREADAALPLRERDVERWTRAEDRALADLDGALTRIASPDDVAAVVAHAYEQGGRAAEPGAQVMVLHRLVAALTWRAFGREAEAFAATSKAPALPLAA